MTDEMVDAPAVAATDGTFAGVAEVSPPLTDDADPDVISNASSETSSDLDSDGTSDAAAETPAQATTGEASEDGAHVSADVIDSFKEIHRELLAPGPEAALHAKISQEVIDMLDRWGERFAEHHDAQRECERRDFHARLKLVAPALGGGPPITVDVWARNVSQNGASFLFRGPLSFLTGQEDKNRNIILCMDPGLKQTCWLHAEIIRERPVHRNFHEFGVRFLKSLTVTVVD